jgi:hypothetical protein
MATATYDGAKESLKTVRAAIGAARRRTTPELALVRSEPGRAARPGAASRSPGILRGVGASVAIATGYVALVAALRWVLSLA